MIISYIHSFLRMSAFQNVLIKQGQRALALSCILLDFFNLSADILKLPFTPVDYMFDRIQVH